MGSGGLGGTLGQASKEPVSQPRAAGAAEISSERVACRLAGKAAPGSGSGAPRGMGTPGGLCSPHSDHGAGVGCPASRLSTQGRACLWKPHTFSGAFGSRGTQESSSFCPWGPR